MVLSDRCPTHIIVVIVDQVLMARARYWAEMTKLWLMVAIVALVLSAVQCAKEDDVGHDTREFMQQESLHNLSFNANLQACTSICNSVPRT